jgi:hypothetical protein
MEGISGRNPPFDNPHDFTDSAERVRIDDWRWDFFIFGRIR